MNKNQAPKEPGIVYPALVVEARKGNPFMMFHVYYKATDFTMLGNVPNNREFSKGLVFDASGSVLNYEGASGWPRFSPGVCQVLDILFLPGVFTKLLSYFVFFGPKIVARQSCSVGDYRVKMLKAIATFERSELRELEYNISDKSDFVSILEALEHWRFFGGKRDEDGHLKFLEDGTLNPDYSE